MNGNLQSTGYRRERIALLTQHGKERVIAPLFLEALGACVERVDGYDTDRLGTFTREIPRDGTQLEAARIKARTGMKLTGLHIGLASEGAFGPDPFSGTLPWNVELVLLIDDRWQIEVCGLAQTPARHHHGLFGTIEALDDFAPQAGFPEHFLVVRPECDNDPRIRKGLSDWKSLRENFLWARSQSATGRVFVESDLRAHANPSRMQNIRAATENLILRIESRCPACSVPGFWLVERIVGLPCSWCGSPTREPRAERFGCIKCQHQEVRDRIAPDHADPARCDVCNP